MSLDSKGKYSKDDAYRESLKRRLRDKISEKDRHYLTRFLSCPFPQIESKSEDKEKQTHNSRVQNKASQTDSREWAGQAYYEDVIEWLNYQAKQKEEAKDILKIQQCMNASFMFRHHTITNDEPSVQEIKEMFPILFDKRQILEEFERVTVRGTVDHFSSTLESYCSKILLFKSSKPMRKLVWKETENLKYQDANQKQKTKVLDLKMRGALLSLPSLFDEDLDEIIQFESLIPTNDHPVILCPSSMAKAVKMNTSFKLYAEKILICQTKCMIEAFVSFVALFYIFSIEFNRSCIKTTLLMKYLFMNIPLQEEDEDDSSEVMDVKKLLVR